MNKEAALVVFSGGQDSTTCLFWAKREFRKVYALSFLYGQKHQKEVELAQEIARKAEVEFEVMDVSFIGKLGHNSLTDPDMVMDPGEAGRQCSEYLCAGAQPVLPQHCRRLCPRKGYQPHRDGCVANGFQRVSRLQGRIYQIAQRNAQPCHGRAVRTPYSVDVD